MDKKANDKKTTNATKTKKSPAVVDKLVRLTEPKTSEVTYMTKSAEEYQKAKHAGKVRKVTIFFVICLIAAAVYVLALLAGPIFGSGSKIAMLVDEHIFNKFGDANPFVTTVIYIFLGYIIITLLMFAISIFAIKGSKRRKTIVALITSLVKYIGYAILVVLLLNTWNVDPTIIAALIAALGIAIGFGAQGLVGDLLSGLFLIFENAIKVGDYVTFDEFRGEVVDVGIRTTRLRSPLGDVKVINNSELKAFVNMSMHRSVAICDITIEYGENILKVEKIINDNLPNIADRIPEINDGPWYKGVAEFSERGVVLKITAKCNEENRFQVTRDLNRQMKLIFDKHKIKIAVRKIEVVK